jgi:putative ABC transport system permease protein
MTPVVVLGAAAALLLAPLVVSAVRTPALLTMARRNLVRRRTETMLLVGGAMLGTAIITSAFVVGDVIDASLSDVARTQYGPVDLTVTATGSADIDEVVAALDRAGLDDIDGTLAATTATAALEAPQRGTAVPQVRLVELDLEAARGFGSDPQITGLATAAPLGSGEVVLNERLADRLGVGAGDDIAVHAYGSVLELRVGEVLDEVGIAGYGGAFVAPGTLARLTADRAPGAEPPGDHLLVSLVGGVFDTRDRSGPALADVRTAVEGLDGVEVAAPKAELLSEAERDGAAYTELFGTVGTFSVLAGILLLVNLFVMLAAERQTELGMVRALGFTRRRLTRAFGLEGAMYAVPAAVLGAITGIGIGWVVAVVARAAFGLADEGSGAPLVVEPLSLAIGALTGLVVSLVTIWATSLRIARLNVIRAIRDLPAPHPGPASGRALAVGAAGAVLGGLLSLAGYLVQDPILLQIGVPIAAFSAAPLLPRVLPDRTARLAVAVVVLGWGFAALPLFPDIMAGLDTAAFVVQGVVLTAGAVSLVTSLDRVWMLVVDRLGRGGRGLAARLGVAYPLARRFRTSMLLGMFSLVIFTVTIIAAVTVTFERASDDLVAGVAAGYDVVLDTNPDAPIAPAVLTSRDDVVATAALDRGTASFQADHLEDASTAWITGFDDGLLRRDAPALFRRDPAYPTDADVYRAVLDDPTLAIVPEGFLVTDMATSVLGIGDTFSVLDPDGGAPRQLTVAALGELDWLGNGAMVSREVTAGLFGARGGVPRWYLAVPNGADAGRVAAALDADLLAHGAQAVSFTALVSDGLDQQLRFMALVQGFLGLGLLVGIAGLAVVMVRAVRERRQEIGMLRAMGVRTGVVRGALLFEAGLVCVQGTAIGAALGLVTARQLLVGAEAFGDGQLSFHAPWGALVVIVGLPLLASLVATSWPASRAAALPPALALRTVD